MNENNANLCEMEQEIFQIKDKYKLRIWLDKDVDVSDWNENTKFEYKFNFSLDKYKSNLFTSIPLEVKFLIQSQPLVEYLSSQSSTFTKFLFACTN